MSSGPFGVEVDVQVLSDLETTRLVSAVGLVILLYDYLLSLPDEVQFIWPATWTSSKILFLGMRYCVPLVMIVHTIQLSGLANVFLADDFCKAWYIIGLLLGWLTVGINDWLVLLRLWVLWDRSRTFIVGTLCIFFLSNISMLVITVIGILRMIPGLHFQPFLQICLFETTPQALRVLWLPGLIFEFIMILAMGWKIFMHPPTFMTLLRDGYLYFLFLFGLNLLNTTIVLSARPSLLFVTVFFMWCFTTTATCRMILSLRRSSSSDGPKSSGSDDRNEDPPGEHQSVADHDLELAWLRQQSMSTTRDSTPTPRRSAF